jgi:hypothetical protein
MRNKCPYCDVEVNENRLEKHKKKCLIRIQRVKNELSKLQYSVKSKKSCPKCNIPIKKGKECPFCHIALKKGIKKHNKTVNKKASKPNKSLKPQPYDNAPIYKPIENINAPIKIPIKEKDDKKLDGSYGSHILRDLDGRFGSHSSHDDYDEESLP